ncbi:MAG: SCO family protein [Acidimicrobiales bacterium]
MRAMPRLADWSTPMELSRVPHRPATGFTLTDQRGQVRSLASLRGKPVALYFMDSKCTDVCPLVAQELIDADRDLGRTASRVVLVGVDVTPAATGVHSLRVFDHEHGLDKLANWYYFTGPLKFTGPLETLKSVWQHYTISVQITRAGDVVHTTLVDFIGRRGILQKLTVPQAYTHPNGTGYLPVSGRTGRVPGRRDEGRASRSQPCDHRRRPPGDGGCRRTERRPLRVRQLGHAEGAGQLVGNRRRAGAGRRLPRPGNDSVEGGLRLGERERWPQRPGHTAVLHH